ncbi:MAG: methyltransferase [Candidatus Aminicenantes bacterium]|nr:methyltransferase [Candidatus Aminicenantes bacterium]
MNTNSRQIVQKTLEFDSPLRIPRQVWVLPWAEKKYPETITQLHKQYPDDIVPSPALYKKPLKTKGDRYSPGPYVDEWGCQFSNPRDGIIGIVKQPLISKWEDLETFQPPEEILDLDQEQINAFCKNTDQFILAGTVTRPFERLQFIRTMEKTLTDLLEKPPELFELINQIHSLYCKEVEVWAQTDIDGISLMDDWGTQQGLIVNPEIFNQIFLPLYKDYADIASAHGKYVFMHSDGYITDIIQALIDAGIHALNSQLFCMDIPELGKKFRGKITFWGEMDRQELLVNGSKPDIEKAVYFVWNHLFQEGGVIAQCEFGLEAKPENIFHTFKAWDELSKTHITSF